MSKIDTNTKMYIALTCATAVREYLVKKYNGFLDGKCKEAADLLVVELAKHGIKASKHYGACIYDTCVGITGEPWAPHCYVLVHDGKSRVYLDITATQFQSVIDKHIPEVILTKEKPYWFRDNKPSIRDMEETAGY